MIHTTVVGSWPLPECYADRLEKYHRGEASEAETDPILRAAIPLALREQKTTGIDEVTGGELAFDPFLTRLPHRLTGIEGLRDGAAPARRCGSFYRLVDRLRAPRGLGHAVAFRRERSIDAGIHKASCPGPLTLLNFLLLVDPRALSALPDAVEIVRREVAALAHAGAREVQIDAITEVAAVRLLNQEPAAVARAIASVFVGSRNIVRTVHLCFAGVQAAGSTPEENLRGVLPVIEHLADKVDRVHLDCTDPSIPALLSGLPRDLELVAGVASAGGEPEPVDILVARIRAVLRHVPAERLLVAPSCGLRACTGRQAIGILTHLVAAACRCAA